MYTTLYAIIKHSLPVPGLSVLTGGTVSGLSVVIWGTAIVLPEPSDPKLKPEVLEHTTVLTS